jgi:hypothetical protein
MDPERKKTINGHEVCEFYWAGKMVVYINHHLTPETFPAACERLASLKDGEDPLKLPEDHAA